MNQRQQLLEDEYLVVRHSGEIPEITYLSSLYYLGQDPDGPRLVLTGEEKAVLAEAALARHREIIFRDLDPANRDLPLFRGPRRTIYNFLRYRNFCDRLNHDGSDILPELRSRLLTFLTQELKDVQAGARPSAVNCTASELTRFTQLIGIDTGTLPRGWQELCREAEPDQGIPW